MKLASLLFFAANFVAAMADTSMKQDHVLDERGISTFVSKIKEQQENLHSVIVLKGILKDIAEFQIAKAKEGYSSEVSKRGDAVEILLTKVFVALKKSGLLLPLTKLTLSEYKTREATAKLVIELLKADVIPYEEVFTAIKESGLLIQLTQFALTDEPTRDGLGQLIVQILPELLKSNSIDSTQVMQIAQEAELSKENIVQVNPSIAGVL